MTFHSNMLSEDCSYLERMHEEYNELSDRVYRLNDFINKSEVYITLPLVEQCDMKEQLYAMRIYLGVLTRRLKRAGVNLDTPTKMVLEK